MQSGKHTQLIPDTETAILRAAEKEFIAKGFSGARTTSIAEAAGVTHAMLHYYFRTKQNLFDTIVAAKVDLLKQALISPLLDRNKSLECILRDIISRHMDFIAANPDLPRFLIEEAYNQTDRSSSFLDQIRKHAPVMLRALQEKIDEAAAIGQCRRIEAEMLMLDIASLNIFPFLAAPVVNAALGPLTADRSGFLEARKRENFDTIMRKLRP
ncbi:MAG: TetR/AcrR family transcriptional regulator [Muribaculaceae bacterium]|nr:TetR/AcrR family transcriptional regulator [Muribaculaceae bacterium]